LPVQKGVEMFKVDEELYETLFARTRYIIAQDLVSLLETAANRIKVLSNSVQLGERGFQAKLEAADAEYKEWKADWQGLYADLEAERDASREAAKIALDEMCRTVAPRDSFTDAVDALDAALAPKGGKT
jgi:hypothetical protein